MPNSETNSNSSSWVAHELHDGLMQWIFAAKLKVEALRGKNGPVESASLDDVLSILGVAHAEGRALINHLEGSAESAASNPFALLADFVEQASVIQPQSFSVKLDRRWFVEAARFSDDVTGCLASTAWGMLRIGQQAVFNCLKHSERADVTVSLRLVEPMALELVVEGHQTPSDRAQASFEIEESRLGIASMKQRAAQLGAALNLQIQPGYSKVHLVLPM